jgi:hypothetical protein
MKTESTDSSVIEITVPKSYNPNASSPEEHLMNLKFQLAAVYFWLSNSAQIEHARANARAKSRCVLKAAEELFAALKRQDGRR